MDFNRLEEFLVIAEEKSFKKAAARLKIAPNVLSTRFRSFENSLGTELFVRNSHIFELTESGRILLNSANSLLDSYHAVCTSMKGIQGTSYRSLRIMLCAQTMAAELGPFLDLYSRKYPKLFLGLYDENHCRIIDGLKAGQVDIVFTVGRKEDFSEVSGRLVLGEFPRMKVHVANDHPLAKKSRICFQDLSGETFILYPKMKDTFIRDLQFSMLEQSGIEYQIYNEDYSPFFYDLLVPIAKGIRLWNWNDRLAPNSSLLSIDDNGYEACMYLLFNDKTENETALHFIRNYLQFRKERR